MLKYTPIIIIGAPRSGTNMLRDILTRIPNVGTWPCDEINYIWRHGHREYANDEFPPEFATPTVKSFTRRAFDQEARRQDLKFLVEKTCANSLRVGFVDQIFPEAKYIFLIRDGRDTTASAMKRWKAPLDLLYTLRKARFVPITDIPYYSFRFFQNRVTQLTSQDRKVKFWGPIYDGMDEDLNTKTVAEICARQWKRCVNNSERDFAHIDPNRIYRVQYEAFVSNPTQAMQGIGDFLGLQGVDYSLYTTDVTKANIGKWRRDLAQNDLERILPIIQDELIRYGHIES